MAAVAASDRSNVVQEDVAAAAATRADHDTGSAVAANSVSEITAAVAARFATSSENTDMSDAN